MDSPSTHARPDYLERIRAVTGGRGVELILEMLANVNAAADLTLLGQRGRLVVIGNRGPTELNLRDVMVREADIRGVMLLHASPAELAEAYHAIGLALASGACAPVVARELPLAEAAEAHRAVMEPGACGKIVLLP